MGQIYQATADEIRAQSPHRSTIRTRRTHQPRPFGDKVGSRPNGHRQDFCAFKIHVEQLVATDEQFLETPFYGSRQMTRWLRRQGDTVSRKRVRRLMRLLGVHAIFQRPRTSQAHPAHRVYPYLLRDLQITRPNHVWCTDVTYIPLQRGFLYLVAVMDWASRKVLSWRLSNTLDARFCVDALHEALERYGPPEIFNSDQGSQFTSVDFTDVLKEAGICISMEAAFPGSDRNRLVDGLLRPAPAPLVAQRPDAAGGVH